MVIEKIIDRICGILIHFWNNTEHQQNFKFYSRMKRVYSLAPKLEWKIAKVYIFIGTYVKVIRGNGGQGHCYSGLLYKVKVTKLHQTNIQRQRKAKRDLENSLEFRKSR